MELGYWVRSDRHQRGYATVAARALTTAAFEYLGDAERVEIHIDIRNERSLGVASKLGYQLDRTENRERLAPAQTGVWRVFVMRRERWEEQPTGAA